MLKDLMVIACSDVDFWTSVTGTLAISWMDRKQVNMAQTWLTCS